MFLLFTEEKIRRKACSPSRKSHFFSFEYWRTGANSELNFCMENERKRSKFRKFIRTAAVWISSSFLSMLVLMACFIPAIWWNEIALAEVFFGDGLEDVVTLHLCLSMSLAIGIATFLSSYLLLGHPTAYFAACFCASPSVCSNITVLSLVLIPSLLGAICGYYLNRYTKFRARRNSDAKIQFLQIRLVLLLGCILMSLFLLSTGNWHWFAYVIWVVKLFIYLAAALIGMFERTSPGNSSIQTT